jgi:hypothetical protein
MARLRATALGQRPNATLGAMVVHLAVMAHAIAVGCTPTTADQFWNAPLILPTPPPAATPGRAPAATATPTTLPAQPATTATPSPDDHQH